MLNNEQIKILWPQIKLGLKNLWGLLDDEELERTQGDFSAITELVQEKYNEDREETTHKLEQLMQSFDNDTDNGISPDVSSFQRSPVNDDCNARH